MLQGSEGKGSAVSLLEDVLQGRGKAHLEAPGGITARADNGQQAALVVPAHLLPLDSATFDADFRGGEQVAALPSISGSGASHGQRRGSSNMGLAPSSEPGGLGSGSLELMLLPDGPMAHAVSRRSGRRRLHKLHRIPLLSATPPDDYGSAEQDEGGSGDSSGTTSAGRSPAALPGAVPAVAGAADAVSPHAALALQRLQRELVVVAQLPRDCAVLLLPYRVYTQPDLVHVVYDGAGEELLSYLRQRQRLPEVTCRGVMRQLLQALAAMHERRWVHRNLSTETVWVLEDHSGAAVDAPATSPTGTGVRRDSTLRRREPPPRLRVKLGGLTHAAQQSVDPSTGAVVPLRDLVGCAYHLAPEAISGCGYGPPADVWAAGVLLTMLLTGRPPFPGANELEVMTWVMVAATPPQPRSPLRSQDGTEDGGSLAGSLQWQQQPRTSYTGGAGAGAGSTSATSPTAAGGGGGGGVHRRLGGFGGFTFRYLAGGSSSGEVPFRERDTLQEVIVQAALESGASAACREVLAGMLTADPARRLSAAALLKLPWFENDDDGGAPRPA
ncbi:hypothetical protein HYH02_014920 [Chlamydomonas schloesseri]|uniref:Protein kinase domain-containing protein n=1 Tax=Chlamydomonas schloesseri TaxID=2026947 RepID=A0A835SU18_9CHLO|nr:hypothetical protein HYH02_014920 [Chlamydomonas schloesseri]|eukprot:KAG2425856.1 hypothetical protein HYH02_014920 [Chlamydomonas schloesseri]